MNIDSVPKYFSNYNKLKWLFWQFVDSIPKELRRLGGQEWIKPIFDTLFWCEPYSNEGVLHRPEQMVVRSVKVWAIRRVG